MTTFPSSLQLLAAAGKLVAVDWSDTAAAVKQSLGILLQLMDLSDLRCTFDPTAETVTLTGKEKDTNGSRVIKFADIEEFFVTLSAGRSGNATPVTAGP